MLNLGEWLNGRATVSKTVGCVFDSRLPCQALVYKCFFISNIFYTTINNKSKKTFYDSLR